MNAKHMTNGALLVGPVVPPGGIRTGETLSVMGENVEAFAVLSRKYRVRRHTDGWFVDGKGHRSQIWEYGVAKLGLTVTGNRFVIKCQRAGDWLHSKSIGDAEVNFWCDWTDDNLAKLTALTGLQWRKPSTRA